jgi:transposase
MLNPSGGWQGSSRVSSRTQPENVAGVATVAGRAPKSNRKVQYHYDKAVYKKRHLVENLFAKIKDWRRIHTRYDRCAHTFMSAICIAATVIFWLNQ